LIAALMPSKGPCSNLTTRLIAEEKLILRGKRSYSPEALMLSS
jgi:hypothetical protein